MWVPRDVLGLFSMSVGSCSDNLGWGRVIFSANVGRKLRCSRAGRFTLSGRYSYHSPDSHVKNKKLEDRVRQYSRKKKATPPCRRRFKSFKSFKSFPCLKYLLIQYVRRLNDEGYGVSGRGLWGDRTKDMG